MPHITTKHYNTRNREQADIMQRYGDEDGKSAAKFRKRTYGLHGLLAGTAAGIGAGAALGGKGNRLAGAYLGGLGGMVLGGNAGAIIERNPKRKNFSTMTSTTRTLVQFSAHLDNKLAQSGLVEFARDPRKPEESHKLRNAALAVGGLGAAAVGGTYLRGRKAIAASGAPVLMKDGKAVMPSFGNTLRAGADALKGDVSNAAGYVGGKMSAMGSSVYDKAKRMKLGAEGNVGVALRERGYLAS